MRWSFMFDHLKHEYKKIRDEIISGAEYTERCTHAKKLHKKRGGSRWDL